MCSRFSALPFVSLSRHVLKWGLNLAFHSSSWKILPGVYWETCSSGIHIVSKSFVSLHSASQRECSYENTSCTPKHDRTVVTSIASCSSSKGVESFLLAQNLFNSFFFLTDSS